MKITVEAKAFTAATAVAGKVINPGSKFAILQNVKIASNDNRITVRGSDGDTSFEVTVGATVITEGSCCINYSMLSKFISAARSSEVTIEEVDAKVTLHAGRSRITLHSFPEEDFPDYLPPEGDPTTVDPSRFCDALRFAAAAAAKNQAQAHISGPCVRQSSDGATFWGTDGKALHRAILPDVSFGEGATIPAPAVLTMLSVLDKAETASVLICSQGWSASAGHVRAWGKVIGQPFPAADRVWESFPDWTDLASVDTTDMTAGLTVATCGADADSTKARHILMLAEPGKGLTLRGLNGTAGVIHAGRAEVCDDVDAEGRAVVTGTYVQNAIGGVGDRLTISMGHQSNGQETPAIKIRPAQSDSTMEIAAIIMGRRVSNAEMVDV